jgi:hypothetical protein
MAARHSVPNDLAKKAASLVEQLMTPTVPFDYSIGWGNGYRDLFAGTQLTFSPVKSILEQAALSGRVLLCGRAGSGKSVILRQLAKQALAKRNLVVFLDLSRWSPRDESKLSSCLMDTASSMNFLIDKFSNLGASVLDLDLVSPRTTKVIFLDGLNEMPSQLVAIVLRALDDVVTRLINTQVIVADRFSRRQLSEERWRLARVEALSRSSIEKALTGLERESAAHFRPTSRNLLDWPFFLARAVQTERPSAGGAEAMEEFFRDRVHLPDIAMGRIAEASYSAYVTSPSRTFPAPRFATLCGSDAYSKLLDAGVLQNAEGIAYFTHHLHHDFFAARFLAGNPALWGYEAFNALTFQASSFDSIALAFSQAAHDSKPAFVREVYDWNPYAISFALAEGEYRKPEDLDRELEQIILAMLTEKRWDPVIPTAERASDALSLFPLKSASPFLHFSSLDELLKYVAALKSDLNWFNEWKALFCLGADASVPEKTILRLADADSIVGWTLANVLKRIRLVDYSLVRVVQAAGNERAVVRWRAVHVLGAFPSEESSSVAFKLLDDDPDAWVRYGAIRSLVEMSAWADPSVRSTIVSGVVKRSGKISKDSKLRGEFARALRIRADRTDKDWQATALYLLSTFLETSSNVEDLDFWSRVLRQVRIDTNS